MEARIRKEIIAIMRDSEYGKSFIFIPTDDLRISYFLLIGQKDTPYYLGIYLFKSVYPDDYPTNPPICTYYTNCTYRQNPNLYNGRVCLSILGTWGNNSWTSEQDLLSVIRVISACVLNKGCLRNEPFYNQHKISNYLVQQYDQIVVYLNLRYNTYAWISNKFPISDIPLSIFESIKFYINKILNENLSLIIIEVIKLYKLNKCTLISTYINKSIILDYFKVLSDLYRFQMENNPLSKLTKDEIDLFSDQLIADMMFPKDLQVLNLLSYDISTCIKASSGKTASSGGLNLPEIVQILKANKVIPQGDKRKQLLQLLT